MFNLLISSLALHSVAQGPIVPSYDPPPAQAWEQSLLLRCGGTTLRVAGYGAARPLNRPVTITVDGRPLRGTGVAALRRDLSNRRAAYRLAGRCPRQRSSIALFLYAGEQTGGVVSYSAGQALIVNGALRNYSGLEPANSETFWFR